MQQAFAYLRVSGIGQLDGNGLDRQRQAVEAYAASNNIEIIEMFEERGVSGRADSDARPAFQGMIARVMSSDCRIIVIEGLDRLAREYRVQEQLLLYIASKGISLIAANTGEDVTAAVMGDPMRKALVQIQGIFAELDRNMLVAKLRKARAAKKAATGVCEGKKPFGTHAGEARTLARMIELRGAGRSLEQVASQLTDEGLKPRSGQRWYAASVGRILTAQSAHTR